MNELEKIYQTIDVEQLHLLLERYLPGSEGTKYISRRGLIKWVGRSLDVYNTIFPDKISRVLDIGCGIGFLLYIFQFYGHSVLGVDVPDNLLYTDACKILNVERKSFKVQKFRSTNLGKFDMIVATRICFNNHKRKGLWGADEWTFFLDDINDHLNPGGVAWFFLNSETKNKNLNMYGGNAKDILESYEIKSLTKRFIGPVIKVEK